MSEPLYHDDALAWADRQAALLRKVAAGDLVNAPLDWLHIIEEIHDVGLSELRACQSLLQQAMTHLLKLHARPASRSAPHRRDEAGAFLDDATRRLTASMRQRIGLDDLYEKALRRAAAATDDAGAPRAMPGGCPFTLDVLLAGELDALLAAADRRGPG